jgi:hypothetical protein
MPVELSSEFLFDLNVEFGEPRERYDIGDVGSGHRSVNPAAGGSFEGPHLRGEVVGPWPDYILTRPDGVNQHEIRAQLQTEDGALVYMEYTAISHRNSLGPIGGDAPGYFRTLIRFETGAEQYDWLNRIVAVGVPSFRERGLTWSVHAIT